jgi:drug/metabolite transporter (DMT)-like permease
MHPPTLEPKIRGYQCSRQRVSALLNTGAVQPHEYPSKATDLTLHLFSRILDGSPVSFIFIWELDERMNPDSSHQRRAMLLLIIVALLWSTGGFLIKSVTWNPFAIAGTRSAIAALLMLGYRRRFTFNWSAAQLGGAACYAATVILFVAANKLTTAANAILLQYTAPIYVAILSYWFLRERITKLDLAAIAATTLGMVLFFLDDLSRGGFWGNIAAIMSGLSFAGTVLFLRKQKDGSPLESVFLGNILTFLIGLPFSFHAIPNSAGWLGLIFLGIFQLGCSYLLYAEAIRHVTAIEGILIPVLEPILNPLWVFLLLGEKPGRWAAAGGIIVLISVTVRCLMALRQNSRSNVP